MTETGAPAWARTLTDPYGSDLRGPVELLADHLARYTSKETRDRYRVDVGQFLIWMERFHPEVPVLAALPATVEQYRQYLASNHWAGHPGGCWDQCTQLPYSNPGTRQTKMAAISSFYRYCVQQRRSDFNPVLPVPGRKHDRDQLREHEQPILMPDEITSVMDVAKQAATGTGAFKVPTLRTAAIFAVLVGMGLRVDELATARLEGLRWRGKVRTARIHRKGGYYERLDIPARTWKILGAYIGHRTSGAWIISDGRRTRNKETGELEHTSLSPNKIGDAVAELSTACGMDDRLHPHLLRHTSITLALTHPDAGLARVAAYYGHENTKTTMRYNNYRQLLTPGWHRNIYGCDWTTEGVVSAA